MTGEGAPGSAGPSSVTLSWPKGRPAADLMASAVCFCARIAQFPFQFGSVLFQLSGHLESVHASLLYDANSRPLFHATSKLKICGKSISRTGFDIYPA